MFKDWLSSIKSPWESSVIEKDYNKMMEDYDNLGMNIDKDMDEHNEMYCLTQDNLLRLEALKLARDNGCFLDSDEECLTIILYAEAYYNFLSGAPNAVNIIDKYLATSTGLKTILSRHQKSNTPSKPKQPPTTKGTKK